MDEQIAETSQRHRVRHLSIAVSLAMGMILGSAGSAVAIHQFTDVPDSNPFHDDIDWLVDNGIADGFPDGTYKPGSAVTRQSMAAFMRRLAGGDPTVDPMVDAALLEGRTPADFDNAVTLNGRTPADYDNAVTLNGRTPADYDDAVTLDGRTPADYDNAVTLNGATSTQVGQQKWAIVGADGVLALSYTGTTSAKLGTGIYEVVFSSPVITCSYSATLGSPPSGGSGINGQITVAPRSGELRGVYIRTLDSAGAAMDASFHLQVMC